MTCMEFRPGDVLEVITGAKTVSGVVLEQSMYITYEDLQEILKGAEPPAKEDRPRQYRTSKGATFNRVINLFTRAIETGKWSNGADINRDKIAQAFLEKTAGLHPQDMKEIKTKILDKFSSTIRANRGKISATHYDKLSYFVATVRGWI